MSSQFEPPVGDMVPQGLQALIGQGELRHYRKNTLLMQEGDAGDTLYLVMRGSLRSFAMSEAGREITYGTHGPGELLGEACLTGGLRTSSVITQAPSSCVVVGRAALLALLPQQPALAWALITLLVQREQALTGLARRLALEDVYGRLRLLLEQASAPMANGAQAPRLTHQEMANRMGCSREMVTRLLKELEHSGFVRRGPQGIELLRSLPAHW